MRNIAFAGGVEPPRREYFLAGTAQAQFAVLPPEAQRPRITAPLSGSVYALDPDIPPDRQRIRVTVAGAIQGHRLAFDDHVLGSADDPPLLLPGPGTHRLAMIDGSGRVVDKVRFLVR